MTSSSETNSEVWSRKLGITIGRGGKGYNDSIPQCPCCGCYGGGGHGGNCPNIGLVPKQWVIKS